ncbi:hypothetical protein J1614_004171 [Plenodomus biglobosus]|nr:hypothetical protein J1614_004171 [Plenodomus biglobosus]
MYTLQQVHPKAPTHQPLTSKPQMFSPTYYQSAKPPFSRPLASSDTMTIISRNTTTIVHVSDATYTHRRNLAAENDL